jgi:hypothetical protein
MSGCAKKTYLNYVQPHRAKISEMIVLTSVKTSRDYGCNMKVEISMKNLVLEAARSEAPKVS